MVFAAKESGKPQPADPLAHAAPAHWRQPDLRHFSAAPEEVELGGSVLLQPAVAALAMNLDRRDLAHNRVDRAGRNRLRAHAADHLQALSVGVVTLQVYLALAILQL